MSGGMLSRGEVHQQMGWYVSRNNNIINQVHHLNSVFNSILARRNNINKICSKEEMKLDNAMRMLG